LVAIWVVALFEVFWVFSFLKFVMNPISTIGWVMAGVFTVPTASFHNISGFFA
jgi:hypothetical protein